MEVTILIVVNGPQVHKTRASTPTVETVPVSREYDLSGHPTGTTFGGGPITTHSESESIVYTRQPKAFRGRSNMCLHQKSSVDYTGSVSSPVRKVWSDHGVMYDLYIQHTYSANNHAFGVNQANLALNTQFGTGFLGANAQGIINDAAFKLRPDLTTVSLPNFLLDIEDIKTLGVLWRKNIGLAKNLAGGFLNWNFGIKPTIGDVSGMISAVRNFQQKIRDFEKSTDILFHRHIGVSVDNLFVSGVDNMPSDNTKSVDWRCSVERSCTAHVVWKPQPLAVMSAVEKTLRGLLDSLGFELNPRIVWDAIPFTFVVDWFVGIGNFLDHYKIDTLELPIKYVDSYIQYKEIRRYQTRCYQKGGFSTQVPNESSGGWVQVDTLFQRVPIFPDYTTLTSLGWKFPSLHQALLGVSLATVLGKS